MRLAILTTHPIQYQAPVWRGLADYEDLKLHVYFGSDFSVRGYLDKDFGREITWDIPLTEGYPHSFLSTDSAINEAGQLNLDIQDFQKRLKCFQPDCALINGYSPASFYIKGVAVLIRMKIPVLLRAETSDEALPRSFYKTIGRNIVLRGLYSQIDKFLVIGENARRHYLAKGVHPERIYWSPYSIDSGFLNKQIERYLPRRVEIRRKLGFDPSQTVFLFSGKLIPKKDPSIITTALEKLSEITRTNVGLVVVGDGQLRSSFETEIKAIPGITSVFAGFINQTDLGWYYAAADCLILPSRWGETWGLVVNEALQFGMPVIVSDMVGSRHDLVRSGETGFVFPAGDAAALAQRMEYIIRLSCEQRELFGERCRQKATEYSLQKSIAGIYAALKCQ